MSARVSLGRKFARLATNAVMRSPWLWRVFRPGIQKQFEMLAPEWDSMRSPTHLAAFEVALDSVTPPKRALDLGTGTGAGALAVARRFPDAEVVGADLSEAMIAEARRKLPEELAERVRFETADASKLRYADGEFDLVTLANMIPFFDEVARVVAAGGQVLLSFSSGAGTPIYVPTERLRAELGKRGFADFEEFESAPATALLATRQTA